MTLTAGFDHFRAAARSQTHSWARSLRNGVAHLREDETLSTRLVLVGLAVALQNVVELPRELLNWTFTVPGAGVVMFLALGASLALLVRAFMPIPSAWRWLRRPWLQGVVLALTLVGAFMSIPKLGTIAMASVSPPDYSNDGTTLDHYAAQELLAGRNPYVTTDIVAAIRAFHLDPIHTTPLHRGAFAALPWTAYPSHDQLRQVFASEPEHRPNQVREYESHVSYPVLCFLPLVPLVWAGLPNVLPFFILCFLGLAALLIYWTPTSARPWVALLLLADAPLLDATLAGDLNLLYILLLVIAWRYLDRPVHSTVAAGLALAAKQLAWFYLPYYLIIVWRRQGLRAAAVRLAGMVGIFLALNLPFIVNNPGAWVAGVLAPEVDPMFPVGSGLIKLPLVGVGPLWPSTVYLVLEAAALVASVIWFARKGYRAPELAFVLAVVPLFLAWRSLSSYFYFAALPGLGLLLARMRDERDLSASAPNPAWTEPVASR